MEGQKAPVSHSLSDPHFFQNCLSQHIGKEEKAVTASARHTSLVTLCSKWEAAGERRGPSGRIQESSSIHAIHSHRGESKATPLLWEWVSSPEKWRSWSIWAIWYLMVLNFWDSLIIRIWTFYFLSALTSFMKLWKSQQGWASYMGRISLAVSFPG